MARYEWIGTRPNSAFRVHQEYFEDKRDRFAPFLDPTTGGPVQLVYAGTDIPVDGKYIHKHTDRRDQQFGKVDVDNHTMPAAAAALGEEVEA